MATATANIIRAQNDLYRSRLLGSSGVPGQTMLTRGVANLPPETLRPLLQAVSTFRDFTKDNDPYGEHDFGAVELDGARYFWKIDYYADANLTDGAEDQTACYRVLTIMRADEY